MHVLLLNHAEPGDVVLCVCSYHKFLFALIKRESLWVSETFRLAYMGEGFELVLGPKKCFQWLMKTRIFLLHDKFQRSFLGLKVQHSISLAECLSTIREGRLGL